MTQSPIRFFADDAAVRAIASGLLARTLPRSEWTHEAHLAACACLILEHPEMDLERELRGTISRYNEAVGGMNDDTQGYHETITQFYLRAVRAHLAECSAGTLAARINALLVSERGRRDYPLRFYSPELLFSVEARRAFASPDLMPLSQI